MKWIVSISIFFICFIRYFILYFISIL
uniref:Uncharacterized protein n=1 Tax=Spirodela intermedia TaxID=51605 RepID=A0A8S0XWB0_SPIIN